MGTALVVLLLGQFRYAAAVDQPAEAPRASAAGEPGGPFPARALSKLVAPDLFVPPRRPRSKASRDALDRPAAQPPARRYRWAADPGDPRVILWGYDDPATGRFLWVSRHWRSNHPGTHPAAR